MPQRRPHTKSKNGCTRCKQRRIKCSEGLPKCQHCQVRNLDCQYPRIRSERSAAEGSHNETTPPSLKASPFLRTPPSLEESHFLPSSRQLEARLLHQYYNSTSLTISKASTVHQWRVYYPGIAATNEFVLDSMLAFTALHLAFLETERRHSWTEIALRYSHGACSQFSKVVCNISSTTVEPALACSGFIVLFAIAQHGISGITSSSSHLTEILRVMNLVKGCTLLITKAQSYGVRGVLKRQSSFEDTPGAPTETIEKTNSDHPLGHILCRLGSMVLTQLQQLTNSTSNSHHDICIAACLDLLDRAHQIKDNFDETKIFTWPFGTDVAFIDLLQSGNLDARILFLLYALSLHHMKHKWFINDTGQNLGRELIGPDDPLPTHWVEIVSCIRAEFE